MSIKLTQKGEFDHLEAFLTGMKESDLGSVISQYGELGANALSNATPVESGETAASWYYEIVQRPGYFSIRWNNHHVEDGVPIAVILQYGHGTGTGGYVQGRDYIMPAIRPIFDLIEKEVVALLSKH
jgi:hypothetical protein